MNFFKSMKLRRLIGLKNHLDRIKRMFQLSFTYKEWPEDALENVANKSLKQLDITDEEKKSCVEICKYFHVTSNGLSER
jgi:hypothetical protein